MAEIDHHRVNLLAHDPSSYLGNEPPCPLWADVDIGRLLMSAQSGVTALGRRVAPGTNRVALLIRVIALHDVTSRIVGGTPDKQDPGFEVAVLFPVICHPTLAGNFVGAGFGEFVCVDGGEIADFACTAARTSGRRGHDGVSHIYTLVDE